MKTKHWGLIAVLAAMFVLAFSATSVFGANGEGLGKGKGRAGDVVPDSYIVVLQDGASSDAVAKKHGVALGRKFTAVFNGFSGKVPPGRLGALRDDPNVISVSTDRVVKAHGKPEGAGKGGGKPGGKKDAKPSVTITNPNDGDTVSSSVNVTANATDDKGATQVEFFVGGASIGVDTTAPYSASWDTTAGTDGTVNVSATATDTIGQTGNDSVSVTVDIGLGNCGQWRRH